MEHPDSVSIKSFGVFLFILFTGVLVTVIMLNTTNKDGSKNDIRSHASDPADTIVVSDSLLNMSAQAFAETEDDRDLINDTESQQDAADEAEVNAL